MNKKLLLALITGLIVAFFVGFFVLGRDATAPETTTSEQPASSQRTTAQAETTKLTEAEVAKHNTENDCWVIVNGSVYDVTSFIGQHPGGASAITQACGSDGTGIFQGTQSNGRRGGHSSSEQDQLDSFKVGDLQ